MKDRASCSVLRASWRKVRAVFAAVVIAGGCGSAWAGIPASAYVQEGLVVQFDGIDNAGTGTHDPSATVWKDLVAANEGAYDMTLTANGNFTDTALVSDGKKTAAKGASPAVTIGQIEGCYTLDSDKTVNSAVYATGLVTGSNMDWCIGLLSTHRGYLFGGNTPMFAVGNDYSGFHTISSTKSDCFYDGSSDSVTKGANNYFGSTTARQPGTAAVGGFGDGDTPCAVKMHSIRIYNRALTAEEIALNAEMDQARFGFNSGDYRWNDETEKLERHVCVAVNDETRGSVVAKVDGFAVSSSSFWYTAGSSVELTPTPANGYKFVRWLGDMSGVEVDSDGVATFSGFAHKLTAIFAMSSADPKDRTWSGAGDGRDWFDENNWQPVGVPAEGDFVTIGTGKSIVLTNSTEAVSSLSLASTLACSNWTTCIRAVDVKLLSGAVIKPVCAFADAEMSNRVWIACHNIEVQSGGSINANNLGYKTGNGPCWKGSPVSSQASSYGGMAGSVATYGSVTEPEDPGSGAGSGGTAGGGAVLIDATGSLALNGTITATGAGGSYWGPGDSGGGVYISCASITGVGSVSANAGNHTGDGAAYYNGGGGRIAVHYNPSVQDEVGACEVRFNANGGVRKGNTTAGARCSQVSGAGSLYFTDGRFLHRPKVDLCGVVWIDDNGTAVQPTEYAFAAGQDFTNSKLEFPCDDTVVMYDGDLSFAGTLTRAYGFRFTGFRPKLTVTGDVCLQGAAIEATRGLDFVVGGDLTLTDGTINGTASDIRITAGPTNETVTTYGATVDVGGKLTVGGNGYVSTGCCSTNGSIVALHVGAFRLDATGVLTASGLGWNLANVPGWPSGWTYGAAHGGRGGYNNLPVKFYGTCYDEKRNPMQPGAGSRNSGGVAAAAGGGVVFLRCDGDMVIDGTISADGLVCTAWRGGTAGGSVNLACKGRLSGSGSVSAKGGPRSTSGNNAKPSGADGGAGGGGRIAIRYGSLVDGQTLLDHLSAAGGTGTKFDDTDYFGYAEDGTIYVKGGGLKIFVR